MGELVGELAWLANLHWAKGQQFFNPGLQKKSTRHSQSGYSNLQ